MVRQPLANAKRLPGIINRTIGYRKDLGRSINRNAWTPFTDAKPDYLSCVRRVPRCGPLLSSMRHLRTHIAHVLRKLSARASIANEDLVSSRGDWTRAERSVITAPGNLFQ